MCLFFFFWLNFSFLSQSCDCSIKFRFHLSSASATHHFFYFLSSLEVFWFMSPIPRWRSSQLFFSFPSIFWKKKLKNNRHRNCLTSHFPPFTFLFYSYIYIYIYLYSYSHWFHNWINCTGKLFFLHLLEIESIPSFWSLKSPHFCLQHSTAFFLALIHM